MPNIRTKGDRRLGAAARKRRRQRSTKKCSPASLKNRPPIVPVHPTETEPPLQPPTVAAEDEFTRKTKNAKIEIEPVAEAAGTVEAPPESFPDAEEGPVHRLFIRARCPDP